MIIHVKFKTRNRLQFTKNIGNVDVNGDLFRPQVTLELSLVQIDVSIKYLYRKDNDEFYIKHFDSIPYNLF